MTARSVSSRYVPDQEQAMFPYGTGVLSSSTLFDATLTHAVHFIKNDIAQTLHPLHLCGCGGEQQDFKAGRHSDQDARPVFIVSEVTRERADDYL